SAVAARRSNTPWQLQSAAQERENVRGARPLRRTAEPPPTGPHVVRRCTLVRSYHPRAARILFRAVSQASRPPNRDIQTRVAVSLGYPTRRESHCTEPPR